MQKLPLARDKLKKSIFEIDVIKIDLKWYNGKLNN